MVEYKPYAKEILDAVAPFRKIPRTPPFLHGLHYGEMAVFGILMQISDSKENITMSEVSSALDISKSALSQLVNRLEEKGLVERVYSKEDRRAIFLTFTPKGKEIYRKNHDFMILMGNAIVEKMGEDDSKTLILLLERFFEVLAEIREENPCPMEDEKC